MNKINVINKGKGKFQEGVAVLQELEQEKNGEMVKMVKS